MLVLGFDDYRVPAQALAQHLSVPYAEVEIHNFPDGENCIRLPVDLPQDLIICRSLNNPNHKLIELLFIARAVRKLGVIHLILVAPYLCYMRQDIAFQPGEIVSQRIIGAIFAELFDKIVTVDPHLHRINRLEEVMPVRSLQVLSATNLMGEFLKNLKNYNDVILLGPDLESKQWVEKIATVSGLKFYIANKQRDGDYQVKIALPCCEYRNKNIILIDDVVSTGKTLAETAKALYNKGVNRIDILVTHGLFVNNSISDLKQIGIKNIWSTDSIIHTTNIIALADLLATGVNK